MIVPKIITYLFLFIEIISPNLLKIGKSSQVLTEKSSKSESSKSPKSSEKSAYHKHSSTENKKRKADE